MAVGTEGVTRLLLLLSLAPRSMELCKSYAHRAQRLLSEAELRLAE